MVPIVWEISIPMIGTRGGQLFGHKFFEWLLLL